MAKKSDVKLYYVSGIRHHAIVLAENKKQAITIVIGSEEKADSRVLYGRVGRWENPEAEELKLPKDYKLVKLKRRA